MRVCSCPVTLPCFMLLCHDKVMQLIAWEVAKKKDTEPDAEAIV